MLKPLSTFIVLIAFSFSSATALAQNTRRDGNYWQTQSQLAKVSYMTGFFDGMELGHNFSVWKNTNSHPESAALAVESFGEYLTKYFSNVTAGQTVAGLDVLYADFQNRRIPLENAVWLVVNQIAGTPTVNEMILSFRRLAQ